MRVHCISGAGLEGARAKSILVRYQRPPGDSAGACTIHSRVHTRARMMFCCQMLRSTGRILAAVCRRGSFALAVRYYSDALALCADLEGEVYYFRTTSIPCNCFRCLTLNDAGRRAVAQQSIHILLPPQSGASHKDITQPPPTNPHVLLDSAIACAAAH